MTNFKMIADELAEEIRSGFRKPGARLPPLRDFAFKRGIAPSTASRVYADLLRRGLTVGEVGRGTFVRDPASDHGTPLVDPANGLVDLELNIPILAKQGAMLRKTLSDLPFAVSLRPAAAAGTTTARAVAAAFLSRDGWRPDPSTILFAGNGKQALNAAIGGLLRRGERLGVEAMTYPVIKTIAARLDIDLVPIAMDEHGLDPEALVAAHAHASLAAIYVQPALHNPLGCSMPTERREALARQLATLGILAIEDAVNSFLADTGAPLAAMAPDHVIHIDSLSKRVAPGLTVGMIVPPAAYVGRLAGALRQGAWTASSFALDMACHWMEGGTATALGLAKRKDAAERQAIARGALAGLDVVADPRSYHLWLRLPEIWRAENFVAAAARRAIAVTPAAAFAAAPGNAPNAVRLALSSPAPAVLNSALATLARLVRSDGDTWGSE